MTTTIDWQTVLKQGISHTTELLQYLQMDPNDFPMALQEPQPFRLRVPKGFAARMQPGNPADPLLLQVLPVAAELLTPAGYTADPLQEKHSNPIPGLLHKYRSRVLLTITSACAINCRFCFRRHFPYADNNPGTQGWQATLDYIRARPEINEVIFSGGDPLIAPDETLAALTEQLAAISHVKTLRIHSRIPIVLPERITPALLQWFTGHRLKPVLILHTNHAQEIDHTVQHALTALKQAGVTLLNQAVLLRGVNDNVEALVNLSETLFAYGVMPYYLHLLDKVQGAAHFDLPLEQAVQLHQQLQLQLPGYLVPKLVREIAGEGSKTLIS